MIPDCEEQMKPDQQGGGIQGADFSIRKRRYGKTKPKNNLVIIPSVPGESGQTG
jgi:hypothetical protein